MRHFGLIHARPQPRPTDGDHLPDDHVDEMTRDLARCVGRLLRDRRPDVGSCRHVADDDSFVPAVSELLRTCPVVVVLDSAVYERSAVRRRIESSGRPLVVIDWVVPANRPVGVVEPAGPRPDRKGLYELFLDRTTRVPAQRAYDERLDEYAAEIVRRLRETDRTQATPSPGAARPQAHLRFDLYLLAPTIGRLPRDREPHQYGSTTLDWNPYRQATDELLRWHLEATLKAQRFQPVVVASFDDGEPALLHEARPRGPSALVLDPWALDDADWREALKRFDRRHQPWVGVVVAWNPDDPQTGGQRRRLRAQLGEVLPRRFERRKLALRAGAPIATDLLSLRAAFSTVVEHAASQYLRYHPPHDP